MDKIKVAAIFADSQHYADQTVTVGGWARTIRDMKTFGFIELNDGSCFKNLQVVMDANELANYMSIVGSAYSVMDGNYQPLYFNINSANLEMTYEDGAETAQLKVSYTSDKLTFEGSYTLTFDEKKGWVMETKGQDDGRQHPLLYLSKLEQKK